MQNQGRNNNGYNNGRGSQNGQNSRNGSGQKSSSDFMKCACKKQLVTSEILQNFQHFITCQPYLAKSSIVKHFREKLCIERLSSNQLQFVLAEILVQKDTISKLLQQRKFYFSY